MVALSEAELLGFVELQVGSQAVQVPIRTAPHAQDQPVAAFATEGEAFAILVKADAPSAAVEPAVRRAAQDALRHLSRKLLN
jgi:hypothetical protein